MGQTMQKSWYLIVAALSLVLLAPSPMAAQPPTTTFDLTGVGSGTVLAGVYTSPYSGNIDGGSTIPVICDDFADESYVPESWTAYVTQASSLTSGTPDSYLKWLGSGSTISVDGYNLNQEEAYTVAAVLAVDIVTSSGEAQEDYSFALWDLFDPPNAVDQLDAYKDYTDATNAMNDLNSAVSYAFNAAIASQVQADVNAVTIYTYDASAGAPTGACSPTCPPPQEFLTVSMPEPASPALLGLDLLGVAGLILFARRRLARAATSTRS